MCICPHSKLKGVTLLGDVHMSDDVHVLTACLHSLSDMTTISDQCLPAKGGILVALPSYSLLK